MSNGSVVTPPTPSSDLAWQYVMQSCVNAFIKNGTECVQSPPTIALDQGLKCTPPAAIQTASVTDTDISHVFCSTVNINTSSYQSIDDCCALAAIIGAYCEAIKTVQANIPPSQLATVNFQIFGNAPPPPGAVTPASSEDELLAMGTAVISIQSTCSGHDAVFQAASVQELVIGGGGAKSIDCGTFNLAVNRASVSVMCILTSIASAIKLVAPNVFVPYPPGCEASLCVPAANPAGASASHVNSNLFWAIVILIVVAVAIVLMSKFQSSSRVTRLRINLS